MSSTGLALPSLEPPHLNGARKAYSPTRVPQRRAPKREDLQVLFPEPGRLEFRSESRFRNWNNPRCHQFIELSLGIHEVREVEIDTFHQTATVVYRPGEDSTQVIRKMARISHPISESELEMPSIGTSPWITSTPPPTAYCS